jgi:phage protein D
MSASLSIRQPGLPATDYYAPNFKVEVEGHELDPESKGDVLDLKVTMDIDNLTSFDLTVNNWDDKRFGFKYSDTSVFDVGNRVHIRMGYADQLLFMAYGVITMLTPNFPDSGPSTLGITGLDAMVKLRDRKPLPNERKIWLQAADREVVQEIAQRNKLPLKVKREGIKYDRIVQKDQDDARFVMERAKRIDLDCYIRVDPDTGLDTLYFLEPSDARTGSVQRVYVFEWGKSLISFSPKLTIGRQVGNVTVRGWDPRTKSPIVYTAGPSDLPGSGAGGGDSGPELAQKRLADKQDIVVDQPVGSLQEARELAISLLRERAYGYLTGSGHVIGLPDLRPGDNVELQGLGKRFSGEYYVTKVEHAIGSSGYTTHFDVRRDRDGGTQ